MRMRTIMAGALLALVQLAPATAAEPGYLDDRSSPRALINSLYNAINTRQYARAWSYFAEPPAADLDAYAAGFDDTRKVNLSIGAPISDHAAGNAYWQVPVAIESVADDGSERVFAGCYTLHLANPGIQDVPFSPLEITGTAIAVSDQPFYNALPASCDGAVADPLEDIRAQAQAAFVANFSQSCRALSDPQDYMPSAPDMHELRYRPSDDPDAKEEVKYLFRFWCDMGAYNEMHVYFIWDDLDGVQPVQFATPELDVRYENDDFEGEVEDVRIIGFNTQTLMINSDYDPESHTVYSHSKWRGIGDASSLGHWLFRQGEFTLVRYDVDASYDDEINPETILDYESAP